MFGFINALFSGCALLGVVYSIFVQMRQLEEQDRRLRESNLLQVLQKMFHDYGSAEMLLAVKELHDLRRRHSEDKEMIKEYNHKYETDYAKIKTLKPVEQLAQAQGTLHHRRRIVMDFFLFLAAVNLSGVVEDPVVLRTFRSSVDVEIIPKILIPLMNGFTEYLGTTSSGKPHDTVQALEVLHKSWTKNP
ncbi:hypothetical protein B7486_10675 [cyanobacterium TDX16]|nr:hypothetical protein B7486_10675 [cyanobacterium TDX16]